MKTEIELQSTVKRIREESETRARKSINLAVRAFTERGAEDGGPLSKNEAFQALDRALHQRGEELSMGEKEIQELARTQCTIHPSGSVTTVNTPILNPIRSSYRSPVISFHLLLLLLLSILP